MFQFTIVRVVLRRTTARRAGPNKLLEREDRLAHVFCVMVFPWDGGQMPRRGLGESLRRRRPRKNSPLPCPKIKKRTKLKIEEERQRAEVVKKSDRLQERKNSQSCP